MSLYRFEGSQETFGKKEKDAGRESNFKSSFLIPHSTFSAQAAETHLENCTGRHSELKQRSRKIPVRGGCCGNSQIRLSFHLNSLRNGMIVEARSSEKERRVDAKALIADEGRDKLR